MDITAVLNLLRPEIRALKAYDNLRGETAEGAVILDSNENVLSPTLELTQQARFRYPLIRPEQLIERLAGIYDVRPDQIMLGRGSDDIIDVLIRAFCRAGQDAILQTIPCFSMYAVSAQIQGAKLKSIELSPENQFQYEIEKVIDALSEQVKLVFLASPQSPTGNLLSTENLSKLLKAAQSQLIVIDEAYIEFANTESAAHLIAEFPNLVIMRTLSKAYGLANLRCGVMLANTRLVNALRPVLTPYALSGLVVDAAYQALQENNLLKLNEFNLSLGERKEYLLQGLNDLSFIGDIYPGNANFLLCQVDDVNTLIGYLEARNIFIRSYASHSSLADYVRISVGSKYEIDSLLSALKEYPEC